ncbi:hypothetical protein GCM10011369_27190 [Neiella marina]|uniref:Uncharacterized protein n=1 Tax=Neiella marina TaxID=508461 RepID=A0A8J2U7D5_9GAMM|nr:hypothetical protein [Neiella marina]GGA83743.1 hypothetical protein GCM10011369_27190 [Neiella marina]
MTSIHRSLEKVAQQYTVFVDDQVLTDQQLNSLSTYLDDHNRLTRTTLTGVGIVEGMNLSLQDDRLLLTRGLAITGDGDLLVNVNSSRFNRIKKYPEQAPNYEPFRHDGERIQLWQLVSEDSKDDDAAPLMDKIDDLAEWLFVLFAETYIDQPSLCTGTNCDNSSSTYTSETRLLATPAKYANQLLADFPVNHLELDALTRSYLPTITISPSLSTQSEWFDAIRNAANVVVTELKQNFSICWKVMQPLLQRHIDGNPTTGWVNRLTAIESKAASETLRLQYYYEFLQDLSLTWNNLLDALALAAPGELMSPGAGAKHLLLGYLSFDNNDGPVPTDATSNSDNPRSGFCPSPALRPDGLEQVKFLLNKLSALLNQFGWGHISSLRITPSSASQPSVPGYYHPRVFQHWDLTANKCQRNRYLLGYHAGQNRPLGGADKPLLRNQQGVDFYRIEGVLGKNYTSTTSALRKLIRQHQLPFNVTGVLIEGSYRQVLGPIVRPANGLRDFEYLLRRDLSDQLADVSIFSKNFRDEVIRQADNDTIRDGDVSDVKGLANQRHELIHRVAKNSVSLLKKPTLNTQERASLNSDIADLVQTSGLFKNDLAKVSTTHFPTQFDQLIGNRTPFWLDWLDRINNEQDKQQAEQHLLSKFVDRHPGLQHSGGVPAGGTFVMVYNNSGNVVGSGHLCHYIEPVEEQVVTPELPKFDPPFQAIPIPGIQVQPSLELSFERKFNDFNQTVETQIADKFQFQTVYADALQNSLGIVRDLYVADSSSPVIDNPIGDVFAEALANNMVALETQIATYDDRMKVASSDQEKAKWQDKKAKAQESMAESIVELADYSATETSMAGTNSNVAVARIIARSAALEGNTAAIAKLTSGIAELNDSPVKTNLAANFGGRFGGL